MSWEVVHMASMTLLMLCLLTCVVYLVTFNIDTMWTRVLRCDVCIAMSWLILALMLWISFVVAVPVSELKASPRKGSRLLLHCALACRWLEFSSFMVKVIVVLLDLYMSCMIDNFSWSVVSSPCWCWWVLVQGSEKFLHPGELPGEKFPVVLQVS